MNTKTKQYKLATGCNYHDAHDWTIGHPLRHGNTLDRVNVGREVYLLRYGVLNNIQVEGELYKADLERDSIFLIVQYFPETRQALVEDAYEKLRKNRVTRSKIIESIIKAQEQVNRKSARKIKQTQTPIRSLGSILAEFELQGVSCKGIIAPVSS